jgi:hypothetical protein
MIAVTSLQYVSERCVRNSWSCDVCGFECETAVTLNDKRTTNESGQTHHALSKSPKRANSNYRKTSVLSSSLFTVRVHRSNFDVVLRKLIFELQAFSQRINETTMVRFHSSVDSNDIVLTMSRDAVFHKTPRVNRPEPLNR